MADEQHHRLSAIERKLDTLEAQLQKLNSTVRQLSERAEQDRTSMQQALDKLQRNSESP